VATTHHLDASQVHYDAPNWIVSAFLPESIFG